MKSEDNKPGIVDRLLKRVSAIKLTNREELAHMIRHSEQNNIIDNNALGMLEGVLQFDRLSVGDIMIPRSNMLYLHHSNSYREILDALQNSGHSRYPVIGDSRDDIEGILHTKDLLKYVGREDEFDIDDILRPAIYVPESQTLVTILTMFRSSRNHMAIVVNEYSGTSGVITIEDVIEQIVGEIDDEHDSIDKKNSITEKDDNLFNVLGGTDVEEFNEFFNANLATDGYSTISGLVCHHAGHIPFQDETVDFSGFEFRVLNSNGRKLQLLEVKRQSPSSS